jgi:hypothetical protein
MPYAAVPSPTRLAPLAADVLVVPAARRPFATFRGHLPDAIDRDHVAERLDASRRRLLAFGRALGPAQWTARPTAPGRWTAGDVMEHLALTEWTVLAFVRGPLQAASPAPRATALDRTSDDALWRAVVDPRVPLDAPERLRPTARWPRPAAHLAAFDAERSATLAYLRATGDPLRAVVAPHPTFGLLDGCQWLLYLAAHTERHLVQLARIARAAA